MKTSKKTATKASVKAKWNGFIRSLLATAAILLISPSVPAQPSTAKDYEVKAGYLIKFIQYTSWPSNTFASSNAPIVIGVLGGEALFRQLEQETWSLASARPVKTRHINTVEEALLCHIVFISEEESRSESQWFQALKGKPILTVGESAKAIERGAIMNFIIKNRNVRFEAHLGAAADNQIHLNERMLAVAARVYKKTSSN